MEKSASGHRLVFVRILVIEARKRGMRVVVAAPRGVVSSPAWREHLGAVETQFETAALGLYPASPRAVRRFAQKYSPDITLIPDGDLYAIRSALNWVLGIHVRVLVMRDPRGEFGPLGVRLKGMVKRAAIAVAGLNPCLDIVWLSQFGDSNPRANAAMDPFVCFESVDRVLGSVAGYRAKMGMSAGVLWFAMVGGLSSRKNVMLAAECLEKFAADSKQRVGLLLAGPIDEDLASSAEDLRRRLPGSIEVAIDAGLKTNDELNVAVAASDRVIVARGLHYPNSNLIKAVALGRPCVFAAPQRAQGRAESLPGVTTCDLDRDALVRALARCAADVASAPRDGYDASQFGGALLG